LRCLVNEYRDRGEEIWSDYKGGKVGTMWYYGSLADIFNKNLENTAVEEFNFLFKESSAESSALATILNIRGEDIVYP
jgi:hypothetical protein